MNTEERVEIQSGDWTDQVKSRIGKLLSRDRGVRPLLFRKWPYRSHWKLTGAVALVSLISLVALIMVHSMQVDVLATPIYDSFLHLIMGLALVGPMALVVLPLWKRVVESWVGYELGDYVYDFGYVEARANGVTFYPWESANLEVHDFRELKNPFTQVVTGAEEVFVISSDFEGDRTAAADALEAYQADPDGPRPLHGLADSVKIDLVSDGRFKKVLRALFPQVGAVAAVVGLSLGAPLSMGVQSWARPAMVDQLRTTYEATKAGLEAHDQDIVAAFEELEEHCDIHGELEDEIGDRLREEVCRKLDTLEEITHFETGMVYAVLDGSTPHNQKVLLERLSRQYKEQRATIMSREMDEQTANFADEVLQGFEKEPRSTVMLRVRPVISNAFETNDNLVSLAEMMAGRPEQKPDAKPDANQGEDSDSVRDDMAADAPDERQLFGGKEFVPAAPYFTGDSASKFVYPVRKRAEMILETLLGHGVPVVEQEVAKPRYVETKTFLDDPEEERTTDTPKKDPLESEQFDALIKNVPDVIGPTMLVTYLIAPGDGFYETTSSNKIFSQLHVRFMVQWVEPGKKVLWSLDKRVEATERIQVRGDQDLSSGASVYDIIGNHAFGQLNKAIREEFAAFEHDYY